MPGDAALAFEWRPRMKDKITRLRELLAGYTAGKGGHTATKGGKLFDTIWIGPPNWAFAHSSGSSPLAFLEAHEELLQLAHELQQRHQVRALVVAGIFPILPRGDAAPVSPRDSVTSEQAKLVLMTRLLVQHFGLYYLDSASTSS